MKFIGVWFCALCTLSLWGGAVPESTEAPANFQLICPNDVVVDCDEDLSNLSKWGDAYVLKDYRRLSAGTPSIVDERNACGIGVITRTWKVEDPNWKWHTCTQVIQVKGGGGFSYADITWPKDLEVDTCHFDAHPSRLPWGYDYPRFANKECSMPAYSYKDEVFSFGDGCTKVIRYWKVLDWCTYKPGQQTGIWQRAQVIKIQRGKGKPSLVCPKDTVIYTSNCDSADVVLDEIIAVNSCGDTLLVENTSDFSDKKFGPANGKYPVGEHSFYYYVNYGCAKEVKCKFNLKVISNKPPTPYCKNGIITTLMPVDTNNDGTIDDGMREVWASDLNAGSYHGCYPHARLKYSFSSDTNDNVIVFTCQNVGINEVEIWVTDEYGNQSFCITYIEVQNNSPKLTDCEPDSLKGGTIRGVVSLSSGAMMEDVAFSLIGDRAAYDVTTTYDTVFLPGGGTRLIPNYDTLWHDLTLSSTTSAGAYAFKNLPMYKSYHLSAFKSDHWLSNVDIWDYYMLDYYLRGFASMTDPVQILAADVDGNGVVNFMDRNQLLMAILNPGEARFAFDSWRFYDDNALDLFKLTKNATTLKASTYDMASLDEKQMNILWTGVKIGDLSSAVNPSGVTSKGGSTLRQASNTACALWETAQGFECTRELVIPDDMLVGKLFLHFDPNQIKSVFSDFDIWIKERKDGIELFWVRDVDAGNVIAFECKSMMLDHPCIDEGQSHAYNAEGVQFDLCLTVADQKDVVMSVVEVSPNPASDFIQIEWINENKGSICIEIFNSIGQSVRTVELGSFDEGLAVADIDIGQLPPAAYIFKLTSEKSYCTGSFLRQ